LSHGDGSRYFARAFNAVQEFIEEMVLAGHDVSGGGLITALLEMCFPERERGMHIEILKDLIEHDQYAFQ
jgi:phosphoribosylformylglycinamidine synthase